MEKTKFNPMRNVSRCGAKTRRNTSCQGLAMKNGRCRMHGGTNPGAPKGNQNALKHGYYTAIAIRQRRDIAALISHCNETLRSF